MSFKDIIKRYNWDEAKESIYAKTSGDVELAINSGFKTAEDFKALVSPAAEPYLEEMARISQSLTQKRFGKTIQMYVPLYLSNACNNSCVYCGFNHSNNIERKILSPEEILREITEIKKQGFEHILLVTGEAQQLVNVDYFKKAIEIIKPHFSNISIEVQPLEEDEYRELNHAGIYAVLVYQETYNPKTYPLYHPKGKKALYDYRIDTPDRAGRAGIHKTGLGVLLGLEDWRTDSFFCYLHLDYLQKKYWQTKYSVSFPRIRPAQGIFEPNVIVKDKELVQLICAYRIINEDLELSISTRESPNFRNNIIKLGATSMSAGSKTNPGGYTVDSNSLEQFTISDERNAFEMAEYIRSIDYEPVWKDWDKALTSL